MLCSKVFVYQNHQGYASESIDGVNFNGLDIPVSWPTRKQTVHLTWLQVRQFIWHFINISQPTIALLRVFERDKEIADVCLPKARAITSITLFDRKPNFFLFNSSNKRLKV